MGDPTRLLSAHSDAEALERALLESLENVPPPDARERDAIWSALAVQLAAVGVVGTAAAAGATGTAAASGAAGSSVAATSAAATTSAAPPALAAAKLASGSALGGLSALVPKTLLAKLVLVGALGGASGGALWLSRTPSAHPPAVRPVAAVPAAARTERHASPPVVDAPVAAPAPALEAPNPASRARKRAAVEHEYEHAKKVDRLVRESRLLTSARAALRDGDLSTAARLLRQLESEFAQGELQQERELLQIELLSARGQDEAAATRARRFVAAHPESPHSARLVRFLR